MVTNPITFYKKVSSGLLPALEIVGVNDSARPTIITESAVIVQLLDGWHSMKNDDEDKVMVPSKKSSQYRQYQYSMQLERELFRWWCTFMFRPESESGSNGSSGGGGMAHVIRGFLVGGNTNNNDTKDGTNTISPQRHVWKKSRP
jgi:glutathione S-transferase